MPSRYSANAEASTTTREPVTGKPAPATRSSPGRPLGRQELYEWWVENRTEGWDDDGPGDDVYPPVVPDGWDEYDATSYEYCPTWQFVHRSHPQAIPVWICGFKGYAPPVVPDA